MRFTLALPSRFVFGPEIDKWERHFALLPKIVGTNSNGWFRTKLVWLVPYEQKFIGDKHTGDDGMSPCYEVRAIGAQESIRTSRIFEENIAGYTLKFLILSCLGVSMYIGLIAIY